MKPAEVQTVIDVVSGAGDFNQGAFSMLVRRMELTGQPIEDLTIGELVNTVRSVRRDYNHVYGEVA